MIEGPSMMNLDGRIPGTMKYGLALLTGMLLGVSFPPSPLSSAAYVSLIPLLVVVDRTEKYWELLRITYVGMFVFNLITLYWVGGFVHARDGYMMLAGGALLLFHPLFFYIPVALYHFVRKRVGTDVALVMFPFAWTAFEYIHSLTDFSFPWLSLGYSQAYDLPRIQIAEFAAVYGVSFLIVTFNVVAYVLLDRLGHRRWTLRSPATLSTIAALLLLYFVPSFWGSGRMDQASSAAGRDLTIGIIQPNVDPWEKWGEGASSKWVSYRKQFESLLAETADMSTVHLDLVVWPETGIPFDILHPANAYYKSQLDSLLSERHITLFTGLPKIQYLTGTRGNSSEVVRGKDYEWYNAATLFSPDSIAAPVYKKVVLVPFAERVPFADVLTFLIEPLKWGVGISGWGKGKDTTVYTLTADGKPATSFSGMICYESVFPSYVRTFVEKGAQFLVIITNDSWWGKTSGAYQHAAYASLRAVETRRWFVRCANGGISGFIDPAGRLFSETDLYTQTALTGTIRALDTESFYVRRGDLFSHVCILACGGFIVFSVVQRRIRKKVQE